MRSGSERVGDFLKLGNKIKIKKVLKNNWEFFLYHFWGKTQKWVLVVSNDLSNNLGFEISCFFSETYFIHNPDTIHNEILREKWNENIKVLFWLILGIECRSDIPSKLEKYIFSNCRSHHEQLVKCGFFVKQLK